MDVVLNNKMYNNLLLDQWKFFCRILLFTHKHQSSNIGEAYSNSSSQCAQLKPLTDLTQTYGGNITRTKPTLKNKNASAPVSSLVGDVNIKHSYIHIQWQAMIIKMARKCPWH